jgi:hypothetical protein
MLAPPLTIGSLLAHLPYALGKLARRLQKKRPAGVSRQGAGVHGNGERWTEHDHLNQPAHVVKDRT